MNEASRWRMAMAHKITPVYATNLRVRAVLVAGSVARGWADPYSDVEIGVFWAELPTPAELAAAMALSRGTMYELDPYSLEEDVWYEEYAVDGLKIDLRHMTVARMAEVLDAVIERGDMSEERQEIIAAVQSGIPLHGAALVESWQARAAHYPDRLARGMVARHIDFPPWWSVPMYAERDDLPMHYTALTQAARRLFDVLLGLNRQYHPGMKWMEQKVGRLPIAPPELAARLKQAFRAEPRAGAEQMRQLIEETFDLVEQQMPDLDLSEVRRAFRSCRPIMDAPPPGWL
jgi:predicted nucleotidyltransferase